MKVTQEKTENRQAFLTIEMEPAEMEESLDKAYQRVVRKANIPGFRKGKAPRGVLERYLGRDRLLEEALDSLLPEACDKAIKEQKLEVFARPQVEITQADPAVFKVTVPLLPEVELGDYRRLQATPAPVTVTEDEVNAVIEQLRHRHATWESVERPVGFGDLAVLNVWSTIEGKPFLNQKDVQYLVLQAQLFPAPGFAEQLTGMKKDEEKEFKLGFPADYPRAELAGKEASFRVRVLEIKQELLPELDDKLAQAINPDFKTVALLREKVTAELKQSAEERASRDFEEKVIELATGITKLEYPPILVESEIDRLLSQQLQRGNQGLEDYLKTIKKTETEIREELRPVATKIVTHSLVLGKVAEAEKVEVADAEVEAEIANMLKGTTEKKEELEKALQTSQARESVKQALLTRKTRRRLAELASGAKEVETTREEGKGK